MTFTSLSYFLFLPLVYFVYYFAKDSYRWLVLLIASYVFYATFKAPQLILSLVLVTAVSYACGIQLGRTSIEGRRKLIFWLGVTFCALLLAIAKLSQPYTIFFCKDAQSTYANLLLTIGISYFSFQAISYLADVYLEIQEPEPHLGYHALALAFFPKLLQGPIERAGDLLPQLKMSYRFDYSTMRSGMLLFTWGLFKKVVVANRLALYSDQVYNHVYDYTGLPLIIATYAYSLQIYFDFAGYTNMARGTARMFGIHLAENFNSPYLATSVADFWRRWHISFSRWILDYIFKPLQMSWRAWGRAGTALALLVTFFLSGLWHGIGKGYVIWGLLHGVYLATSTFYRPYQKKLHERLGMQKSMWFKWWQVLVTFNLISFAWIFFRANDVRQAVYMISNMFCGTKGGVIEYILLKGTANIYIIFLSLIILLLVDKLKAKVEATKSWINNICLRWLCYYIIVFFILYFGMSSSEFIYYQF